MNARENLSESNELHINVILESCERSSVSIILLTMTPKLDMERMRGMKYGKREARKATRNISKRGESYYYDYFI